LQYRNFIQEIYSPQETELVYRLAIYAGQMDIGMEGCGVSFGGVGAPKEVEIGVPYGQEKVLVLVGEEEGFGGEAAAEGVRR
jgi:hypothetical protein